MTEPDTSRRLGAISTDVAGSSRVAVGGEISSWSLRVVFASFRVYRSYRFAWESPFSLSGHQRKLFIFLKVIYFFI